MEVSRKVMRKAAELLEEGVPFALCTIIAAKGSVPGKAGAKMIVMPDGTTHGTVGGAGLEEKAKLLAKGCLAERKGGSFSFDLAYYKEGALDSLCGGSVQMLVEYMAARPHILICGGGHVGLEVARLCDQVEYLHSVLDDRPEYVSRERFPHARGLHAALPADFFPRAELSAFTHVILVGYSHKIDTDALYECVRRFPGYIGLIASRMKRKEMFMRLKARGATEADLARVEAPLGLAIGAESPAEIAVSIVGGLIRHHKLGPQASTATEGVDVEEAEQPQ